MRFRGLLTCNANLLLRRDYQRLSLVSKKALHEAATAGEDSSEELRRRQRKTEWKRRQRGQMFVDHLVVSVHGGKGGDGCAAFHREKYMPYGPPSGGNGGRGGDVYILPTPELTTLNSVSTRIRGVAGGNGKGTWMNGRAGEPTIIRVPVGTVVRQLAESDPKVPHVEEPVDALLGLGEEERVHRLREKRWVHYPGAAEDNVERDAFQEAERTLYKQERDKRMLKREQNPEPIHLDLDSAMESSLSTNVVKTDSLGYLVASGGDGGLGNPAFLTADNRSPKFATRGTEGTRVVLELELKILADVALVGFPNAGKSTLLRALTGGRAQTEVAGYAFTTLNPSVGVVRMTEDGQIVGVGEAGVVIEETEVEERRFKERMARGELSDVSTRDQLLQRTSQSPDHDTDNEVFRFTLADNPGLIEHASENVGLGHSFLRAIERSHAIVYVVDLAGPSPDTELRILREELESYKSGLSTKARLVLANKADLYSSDPAEVELAKTKLKRLEEFVEQSGNQLQLDVVPVSAKYSQNLRRALLLMRKYVQDARSNKDQ